MIYGVGVDLIHLSRLSSLFGRLPSSRSRLADRILTSNERAEFLSYQDLLSDAALQFLATRWAAKEAAYKAVYPLLKPTWKELEVSKVMQKPRIAFVPGKGNEKLQLFLSLSHDQDTVVAVCVAEEKEEGCHCEETKDVRKRHGGHTL
ncbi:4'-phosphopantetheinyl transferase [Atractiella rhizophila]|nr:4'-phosphopantetheinyl transferase [Atractiella rhizophila]